VFVVVLLVGKSLTAEDTLVGQPLFGVDVTDVLVQDQLGLVGEVVLAILTDQPLLNENMDLQMQFLVKTIHRYLTKALCLLNCAPIKA
jgi:hypothetical protein